MAFLINEFLGGQLIYETLARMMAAKNKPQTNKFSGKTDQLTVYENSQIAGKSVA